MIDQADRFMAGTMQIGASDSRGGGRIVSLWRSAMSAAMLAVALTPAVQAEEVARFTFDTMADLRDADDGERVFDASDAALHITREHAAGEVWLSSDVATVAPAGSMTLVLQNAQAMETPETDLYSIGRQDELSVEFWYRPGTTDHQERNILAQSAGPNSWRLYQFAETLYFAATDAGGTTHTLQADDVLSGQWMHLAVTVDNAGQARLYQNGTGIAAGNGFTGFDPYASTLRIGALNGAAPNDPTPGLFQIDDLRISDTALAAGAGSGNDELAWSTSLSAAPDPGPRPDNLGRAWLRTQPFMLNAYAFTAETDTTLYKDAGLNTVLANDNTFHRAADDGIIPHWMGQNIRSYPTLDDKGRTDIHIASHAPDLAAYFVRDEPSHQSMNEIVKPMADYIRSIDSDRPVYVNAYPNHASAEQLWGDDSNPGYTYEQYLDDIMTIVEPDMLMYDHYPFRSYGTDLNDYFDNLTIVRSKAHEYDVPWFAWVQTFTDGSVFRETSASELRFQMFTHLAAGSQGFAYFLYDSSAGGSLGGMLNPDGTPNAMHTRAGEINPEVETLGQTMRMLESTDLRFVPGQTGDVSHTAPTGLVNWSADAGDDPHLESIAVVGEGAGRDGLIGFFTDDDGGLYFMLVNMLQGAELDAAEAELAFTLTFDDSVESLWRMNRETGEVEELVLTDHTLNLTLPGGTGDLFKYDANFAIPEPATASLLMLGGAGLMMRRHP
ncbi:MAG: LamG-like jellyroll fold domain-containing protein [Phycisphaeraceae bacterium]